MFLSSFVFDPKTSASVVTAAIAKGTFRWVTGKVTPRTAPSRLKLPIGDLGIRGTDFQVSAEEGGALVVALREGVVEVTEKVSGRTVVLAPGQQVRFSPTGSMGSAEPFAADTLPSP